jgi:hypothetical protein
MHFVTFCTHNQAQPSHSPSSSSLVSLDSSLDAADGAGAAVTDTPWRTGANAGSSSSDIESIGAAFFALTSFCGLSDAKAYAAAEEGGEPVGI